MLDQYPTGGIENERKENRTMPQELTEKEIGTVVNCLAAIWIEGYRHKLCLCMAGMMVNQRVALQSVLRVVHQAAVQVGADVDRRLEDVRYIYQKAQEGNPVFGFAELQDLISKEFPLKLRDQSLQHLDRILRVLTDMGKPEEKQNG